MNIKFLFVAALTLFVCASCQKEASDYAGQPGLDTYAGMTISLPYELVKSRTLVDGTAAESAIATIKVGTWSDGDNAITYTTLSSSDFTLAADGTYVARKAIKAKTGKTNFIAIANSAQELTIPQVYGEPFARTVADVATDNNFAMYSKEVKSLLAVQLASKDDVEDALPGSDLYKSNITSITLRRAAAKVKVTSSLVTDPTVKGGIIDVSGRVGLYDIKWCVANQNAQMTAIANKLNKNGAFEVKNVNSPFSKIANTTPTLILPTAGEPASSAYCLENSNGLGIYTMANTTAVYVMAIIAPLGGHYIHRIKGTTAAPTIEIGKNNSNERDSFHVLKTTALGVSTGTFFSDQGKKTFEDVLGITPLDDYFTTYTEGVCYWPVYIYDGDIIPNYGVLRNHIYEMNIKSISAPGFNEFPDSNTPISPTTYIGVDISVKEWTDWDMGSVEM